MAERNSSPHPTQRRYPPELRERAVRMVRVTVAEQGERHGAITRVAKTLGIGSGHTLPSRVRRGTQRRPRPDGWVCVTSPSWTSSSRLLSLPMCTGRPTTRTERRGRGRTEPTEAFPPGVTALFLYLQHLQPVNAGGVDSTRGRRRTGRARSALRTQLTTSELPVTPNLGSSTQGYDPVVTERS